MRKSFFYMGVSTLARLLSGAFLMIFVARELGPNEYGDFVFLLSISMAMSMVIEFGHSNYVMRELGRKIIPIDDLLTSIFSAKLILMMVFLIISLMLIYFGVVKYEQREVYFALSLAAIFVTAADFLNVCFRGVDKFRIESINVVIASIFHIALIVIAVKFYGSMVMVAIAFLFSRVLYLAISIAGFLNVFSGQFNFKLFKTPNKFSSNIKIYFPYAADSSLVTLRSYSDIFLISFFLGTNALGLYQAGMNVVRAIENLGPVAANVFLPKLAGLLEKPIAFLKIEKKMVLALSGIGLFCFLVFFFAPFDYLLFVFGQDYYDIFYLFPYFGIYLFVRFSAMAYGVLLTVHGYQSSRAIAGIFSIAFVLLGIVVFVDQFGLEAVVISNIVASLILLGWFAFKINDGHMHFRDQIGLIVSSVVLVSVFYLILWEKV